MKKLIILIALLFVLAVGVLPAAAITFGELDSEHTNVGAMVVDFPVSGGQTVPVQWCSGTLIHPQVFLTAGHCTEPLAAFGIETVWVNFDQFALKKKSLLEVKEIITHPDFEKTGDASMRHDVAVLILDKPMKKKKLAPATLPDESFLDDLEAQGKLHQGSDGAEFTVVGYGLQEPPEFAGEDQRRFAISEFQTLLKAWLRTSQNRSTGDAGSCFGDSGGPVFWTDPDTGDETLVALISWGDAQCKATGFNYRVDIADTLDFINEVIEDLE